MYREIAFCPGAVAAGTSTTIPDGAPDIGVIVGVTLFRGSDGTVAAAEVAATATRVDARTITLDVDTMTRDILVLKYLDLLTYPIP